MAGQTLSYDDIVWASSNLCELLEFENEALSRHDSSAVRAVADNKAALARLYENSIAPLTDEPELAESLEPEQKEELLELGKRLKDLVEENARRLRAEIEATQMLMDAMVSAVKANAANSVAYGRAGAYDSAPNGEQNSIAYNRTL